MATKTLPGASKKSGLKRVAFLTRLEGANEVILTGDFTGWSREGARLSPVGDGRWSTILHLAPGEYQYRLLIDGEWRDHPEAERRMSNAFGTENCLLVVP